MRKGLTAEASHGLHRRRGRSLIVAAIAVLVMGTAASFLISGIYASDRREAGNTRFQAADALQRDKIQDTILICPPAVSQHAALAAIAAGPAYARGHLTSLAAMRKTLYAALSDAAVPCDVNEAAGAFYFFLRVHARLDAMTMTERLIREHGIAVIPGSAFGATDGCYLRISYGALDERTVEEGTRRLVAGLRALA